MSVSEASALATPLSPQRNHGAGSQTEPAPVLGLLDSGLGLVSFAAAVHQELPHVNLALALDPDFAPYGALSHAQIVQRALVSAQALVDAGARILVVACNTASVHALADLRKQFEPDVPVVGTVPAIKPAAQTGKPFAVWATPATTGSVYQRDLISTYAGDLNVYPVACSGLAVAIDNADAPAIAHAISAAAASTPHEAQSVVLGCTHYGLVADQIRAALARPVTLFDSPQAVARQVVRRLGAVAHSMAEVSPDPAPAGRVTRVFLSGRPGVLPESVGAYPLGARVLELQAPAAQWSSAQPVRDT